MFHIYFNQLTEHKERFWKVFICMSIAYIVSRLTGYTYSMTIVCSAMLALYYDRGIKNSHIYVWRRWRNQLVTGTLSILLMLFIRAFVPEIDNTVLLIIVTGLSLLILLPLQEEYVFGPLIVSVINAIMILSLGVVNNYSYIISRLFQCGMGALIDLFCFWVIFPALFPRCRDRYTAAKKEILKSTEIVFARIKGVPSPYPNKEDWHLRDSENNANKDTALLVIDNGIKFKPYKFKLKDHNLVTIVQCMNDLRNKVKVLNANRAKNASIPGFNELLDEAIEKHILLVDSCLRDKKFHIDTLDDKGISAAGHTDILKITPLCEYINEINKVINIQNEYYNVKDVVEYNKTAAVNL